MGLRIIESWIVDKRTERRLSIIINLSILPRQVTSLSLLGVMNKEAFVVFEFYAHAFQVVLTRLSNMRSEALNKIPPHTSLHTCKPVKYEVPSCFIMSDNYYSIRFLHVFHGLYRVELLHLLSYSSYSFFH